MTETEQKTQPFLAVLSATDDSYYPIFERLLNDVEEFSNGTDRLITPRFIHKNHTSAADFLSYTGKKIAVVTCPGQNEMLDALSSATDVKLWGSGKFDRICQNPRLLLSYTSQFKIPVFFGAGPVNRQCGLTYGLCRTKHGFLENCLRIETAFGLTRTINQGDAESIAMETGEIPAVINVDRLEKMFSRVDPEYVGFVFVHVDAEGDISYMSCHDSDGFWFLFTTFFKGNLAKWIYKTVTSRRPLKSIPPGTPCIARRLSIPPWPYRVGVEQMTFTFEADNVFWQGIDRANQELLVRPDSLGSLGWVCGTQSQVEATLEKALQCIHRVQFRE